MPDQITLLIDRFCDAAVRRIATAMQCDWSHHIDMLQSRNCGQCGVDGSDFVESKGCDIAETAASLAPNANSVSLSCCFHKDHVCMLYMLT